MADLLVFPRPVEILQNGARFSGKNLEQTGPAVKERMALVPQSEQLASTPELLLPERRGTQSSAQITRSRGGRESR